MFGIFKRKRILANSEDVVLKFDSILNSIDELYDSSLSCEEIIELNPVNRAIRDHYRVHQKAYDMYLRLEIDNKFMNCQNDLARIVIKNVNMSLKNMFSNYKGMA